MNFDQYSQLAIRTVNPEADNLINAALGLAGESGEIADHIKKAKFQGHELSTADLVNEAGDVLWYINLLAVSLGMTLEQVASQNISKLAARYPGGRFDSERSRNRENG